MSITTKLSKSAIKTAVTAGCVAVTTVTTVATIIPIVKFKKLSHENDSLFEDTMTTLGVIIDNWNDYDTFRDDFDFSIDYATRASNLGISEKELVKREGAFNNIAALYTNLGINYQLATYSCVGFRFKKVFVLHRNIELAQAFNEYCGIIHDALNNITEEDLDNPCTLFDYFKRTIPDLF